jgi:hypothetical protein
MSHPQRRIRTDSSTEHPSSSGCTFNIKTPFHSPNTTEKIAMQYMAVPETAHITVRRGDAMHRPSFEIWRCSGNPASPCSRAMHGIAPTWSQTAQKLRLAQQDESVPQPSMR